MLDDKGKLAVAEVVIYPILLGTCIANFFLAPKSYGGHSKETAWIYLSLFCLAKVVGSAMTIDVESDKNASTSLKITAAIFLSCALSPLMNAASGFATTVANSIAKDSHRGHFFRDYALHLCHLAVIVGIVLSAIGATNSATPKDLKEAKSAVTMLRVGAILFFVAWLLLAAAVGLQWRTRHLLSTNPATMLAAVAAALPFIFVRIVYALLGAFNAKASYPTPSANKFSSSTGQFGYYLVLGFLMELAACLVFCAVGVCLHRFSRSRSSGAAAARPRVPARGDSEQGQPLTQNYAYTNVVQQQQAHYAPYAGYEMSRNDIA